MFYHVWDQTCFEKVSCVNLFNAPACKFSGLKSVHLHACKEHIWWSDDNSVFNFVHFDFFFKLILLPLMRKGEKGFNAFRFGTLIGGFRNDGAASMSVKGLRSTAKERLFRSSRNVIITFKISSTKPLICCCCCCCCFVVVLIFSLFSDKNVFCEGYFLSAGV